jgi:hypothetical protein
MATVRFADMQLSLSRLNHRLPRDQAHPEVVQGTAAFHHQIADAFFPQAEAGSCTPTLRIMFRDLSRAVCVV